MNQTEQRQIISNELMREFPGVAVVCTNDLPTEVKYFRASGSALTANKIEDAYANIAAALAGFIKEHLEETRKQDYDMFMVKWKSEVIYCDGGYKTFYKADCAFSAKSPEHMRQDEDDWHDYSDEGEE